jgi:hypothetical protein
VLKLEVRHITAQGTQYAARQEVQQADAAPKISLSVLTVNMKMNTAALRDIPNYAATTVAFPIAIVATMKYAKVRINFVGDISAAWYRSHATQAQMSRFIAIMKQWRIVVASTDAWPRANVLLMQLGVI